MMSAMNPRHPTTKTWRLPSERPPLEGLARTNLRVLAARSGRFEHHLMVVARIGEAQLECATASEPLYFAHANVSDEYALPLTTGDALVDGAPFRVFVSDEKSGADVARVNHRAGDLVLHPYGYLHWPGRLRPPFETMRVPPGMRRSVLSLVFCASSPAPPVERPLFVSEGRDEDAKSYVPEAPPLLLAELAKTTPGVVARIGAVNARIAEPPFSLPRGGYLLVLDADEQTSWPCDLIYVPAGAQIELDDAKRALLFESEIDEPSAPPSSWEHVPPAPFAPLPDGGTTALPFAHGALEVSEVDANEVEVRIESTSARIPRYWLARMLFRLALHGFALGYVETYGGLYYDDRGGTYRLGLRGASSVVVERAGLARLIETLYRAVAPPGYAEDLG